nr:vegetative cell wall protein gp1-like [Lolium perenne]
MEKREPLRRRHHPPIPKRAYIGPDIRAATPASPSSTEAALPRSPPTPLHHRLEEGSRRRACLIRGGRACSRPLSAAAGSFSAAPVRPHRRLPPSPPSPSPSPFAAHSPSPTPSPPPPCAPVAVSVAGRRLSCRALCARLPSRPLPSRPPPCARLPGRPAPCARSLP